MNINVDFPLILVSLVALTGLISLIDILFFDAKRKAVGGKQPLLVEYSRSFFPVLMLVLVIRSFIFQPFRVVSGSLEPTVEIGDFLAVSQFSYGLRLPVLNTKIMNVGEPKRGDIALFRFPNDPTMIYVKRVIGTPGDHIVYKDKQLTINGKKMKQKIVGTGIATEPGQPPVVMQRRIETLNGIKHEIFIQSHGGELQNIDVIVPKGQYFMMGDNRDQSYDSRSWGTVPENNLIGKAFMIWMSWNSDNSSVRWRRIGNGFTYKPNHVS